MIAMATKMDRPRALRAWAIGAAVFAVAVSYRTALGVAGGDATHRFGLSATQLASFTALQLVVYLILQVPAGVLLDRFGPRFMLTWGLVVMSSAQLLFAVTHSFPCALAARAILATGDVMIFISVLRLIASWFPEKHNPLMNQLAVALGIGCGSIAGTVPLSAALSTLGWNPTFLLTALVGAVSVGIVLVGVRDTRGNGPAEHVASPTSNRRTRHHDITAASRMSELRETWREPGTRLGLWIHFTCQFPRTTFVLLWGLPFLTRGEGYTQATALRLLMLVAVSEMILAPVVGQTIGHLPRSRLPLALGIPLTTAAITAVLLSWPGQSPLWLAIVFAVALGAGNPDR